MQAKGHDPISCVKSFLDTIAVMYVDVNVQNSRVLFQQFEDCQHNVVDVAKACGGAKHTHAYEIQSRADLQKALTVFFNNVCNLASKLKKEDCKYKAYTLQHTKKNGSNTPPVQNKDKSAP